MSKAPPAPGLAGIVRGYTGFVERSATPLRRREVPSPTTVLIVNFGVPLDVAAPGVHAESHSDSFLARVSELPATTEFTGVSAGVQVDFTAIGAHLFCGIEMSDLPAPAISLEDLLGADGRRLTDALAEATGWEERFDLLDAVIGRRVAEAPEPTPSIEWAWGTLSASGGRVPIGSLTERIGCSPGHLIDGFRAHVGVTPKTAARVLRFDRAARILRRPGSGSLAGVATECGYHDQAHMTREFRELGGTTPATYSAAALPGYLGVPG
jgi:AraC-like DNA-binding protein